MERSEEVPRTAFLLTTKATSPPELKKKFLERTQRRFGKLVFSFRRDRPIFFGRSVRKSSKLLHTIQNDEDHVSEKIISRFFEYSVSQDISNAGCTEQSTESTKRSVQKLALPKLDSAFEQKTRIVLSREI